MMISCFSFLSALEIPVDEYGDGVTLFLRLAEYYFEKGEIEKGKEFLIRLCTKTSLNYEDSIALRDMTEIWDKYKHYVIGKVPKSGSDSQSKILSPEECSKQIDEIWKLSEKDLLLGLMEHLEELSGNGCKLRLLNKWERVVYDLNTLLMEVDSGGFDAYLSYHGNRFAQTKKALKEIQAEKMVSLFEVVQSKFPNHKLPKRAESIDAIIIDGEMEFEEEDNYFYEVGTDELLEKLHLYILNHKNRFR